MKSEYRKRALISEGKDTFFDLYIDSQKPDYSNYYQQVSNLSFPTILVHFCVLEPGSSANFLK